MGDILQQQAAAAAADKMEDQALILKEKALQFEALVEAYVASGAGVWEGESAANYRANFAKSVSEVKSICTEAITLSNNIKKAVELMAKANEAA